MGGIAEDERAVGVVIGRTAKGDERAARVLGEAAEEGGLANVGESVSKVGAKETEDVLVGLEGVKGVVGSKEGAGEGALLRSRRETSAALRSATVSRDSAGR